MNKLLKRITTLSAAAVLVFSIAGCGNANKGTTENKTNQSSQSQSVSYPLTIVDSFGNEVTLEKEPERVISAAPNITEIIYDIDAEGKLVGRTDYCDYPPDVLTIESIGTLITPDIEKIIGLEPDIVIASTHFNEENLKKLEDAGIKIISLYEENDVSGVYTMIETLGKALNKQDIAEEKVSEMKKTIGDVESAIKGEKEPTVYYVVSYGEGGDFSAPENTFVGGLIKLAGGQNIVPASDNWSFSLEALLEADPEIIVVGKGQKDGFMSAEGYKELTAVKEGKIYEIDSNIIDRQGYRNAEGVLELAKIFHPEAFK